MRYVWSEITPTSALWEQAFSASDRLGDELRVLRATGRVAERVRPW